MEVWKDIIGYENHYQVSDLGRVKSLTRITTHGHKRKERIMKLSTNNDGYLHVILTNNKIEKTHRINRLVGIHFIPNPDKKPEVGHKFGNKKDNRSISLQWETRSENQIHAYETKLQEGRKGVKHHKSKLDNDMVIDIRNSNLKQFELAKIYNVTPSLISMVISRKIWTHI